MPQFVARFLEEGRGDEDAVHFLDSVEIVVDFFEGGMLKMIVQIQIIMFTGIIDLVTDIYFIITCKLMECSTYIPDIRKGCIRGL